MLQSGILLGDLAAIIEEQNDNILLGMGRLEGAMKRRNKEISP